jgi:hypothetical protein
MTHLIHKDSLALTLNAINDAIIGGRLSKADRQAAAKWIARRYDLPRAYHGTFAGTDRDLAHGIQLFTGEKTTNAAARHIMGEEACRALILLDVPDRAVLSSLNRASESLTKGLCTRVNSRDFGWYCCARCSVSVWRHLTVGGLNHQHLRLAAGMRRLKQYRTGDGRWRAFPFWYTVLALSEIDLPEARRELDYAAPILERAASRKPADDVFARRRTELAARCMA